MSQNNLFRTMRADLAEGLLTTVVYTKVNSDRNWACSLEKINYWTEPWPTFFLCWATIEPHENEIQWPYKSNYLFNRAWRSVTIDSNQCSPLLKMRMEFLQKKLQYYKGGQSSERTQFNKAHDAARVVASCIKLQHECGGKNDLDAFQLAMPTRCGRALF